MPNSVIGDDYKVYFNGSPLSFARLMEVDESVGGRQEGYAIFEVPFIEANSIEALGQLITLGGTWGTYNKGTNHTKILNACQPANIAIGISNKSGSQQENIVHIGVISEVRYADDETGEDVKIISRTDNSMFGVPISGKPTHVGNVRASTALVDQQFGQKWVFNPVIDGKQHPNCWSSVPTYSPDIRRMAFLDLESIPRKYFHEPTLAPENIPVEYWRIQLAIWYLCQILNGEQRYFINPTYDEITSIVTGDDEGLEAILAGKDPGYMLQNFELPLNARLPEALDLILGSFGYFWYTQSIPGNAAKQKITIGKRQNVVRKTGRIRKLYKPLGMNDFRFPTCEEYSIEVDRSNRYASDVLVVGGPITFEITLELMPAWDPKWDKASLGSLSLEKIKEGDRVDVRRKWAANETGEYNAWLTGSIPARGREYRGPRRELYLAIRDAMLHADVSGDLIKPLLASALNRRFKAGKCLTLEETGLFAASGNNESIGTGHGQVLVEVKSRSSSNAVWKEIGTLQGGSSWQLLENEIGLYFTGDLPPSGIKPQRHRMRITCAIELPYCLFANAVVKDDPKFQFLSYRRSHVAHEPTRFNFRRRGSYSQFHNSSQRADEVDDRENIRNYAENLVEAWNSATCEGSATIQGLTTFYRLGDAVEGVHEEEISFDLSASKVRAFPSVTGIRYLPQEQKTVIRFGLFGREDLI